MDHIILKYSYSPGFYGGYVCKDLWISRTFFPDNDEERRQQRRLTTIKDKLPEALKEILKKVIQSDIRVIVPEKIKTDKIEYATSAHPPSEYYEIEIRNEEKDIHIPYHLSDTLIEGEDLDLFFDLHVKLKAWIYEEFEIASEGKAVKPKR